MCMLPILFLQCSMIHACEGSPWGGFLKAPYSNLFSPDSTGGSMPVAVENEEGGSRAPVSACLEVLLSTIQTWHSVFPINAPAQKIDYLTSDDRSPRVEGEWVVSRKKRFRTNIMVWGSPRSLSTLKIRAKFSDLDFVAGNVVAIGRRLR